MAAYRALLENIPAKMHGVGKTRTYPVGEAETTTRLAIDLEVRRGTTETTKPEPEQTDREWIVRCKMGMPKRNPRLIDRQHCSR